MVAWLGESANGWHEVADLLDETFAGPAIEIKAPPEVGDQVTIWCLSL